MSVRKYSVIVFDLGNVLIPFNYDIAIEKLEKIEKNLGEKFIKYYKDNYEIHRKFERGDIPEDEFIRLMLSSVDNKIDEETFCNYYSKVFTVNEDVAALLPRLKEKYRLVLLSNTNSIHQRYGWCEYEFLQNFEKLILSHEVSAVKPEPEIYKAVENYTKEPPEEHIFIDDIKEYVEAAQSMGWDGIHFTGYQVLEKELKERNIL